MPTVGLFTPSHSFILPFTLVHLPTWSSLGRLVIGSSNPQNLRGILANGHNQIPLVGTSVGTIHFQNECYWEHTFIDSYTFICVSCDYVNVACSRNSNPLTNDKFLLNFREKFVQLLPTSSSSRILRHIHPTQPTHHKHS
jgi:hypothetical protein